MGARAHYLKRNADNELPNRVLCFDTESTITPTDQGEVHSLRLGCCHYLKRRGESWDETPYSFRTREEFWALLDGLLINGTCLYLVGHNTAYDYAILDIDNYLSSRGFEIDMFVINAAFIIKAHRDKTSIKIIDTMNWFKAPLRRLGEVFGVSKGEIENFRTATDEELLPYCLQDSNIVKTIFINYIDFISAHDLGNFSITAAGQAFNSYRHRFMRDRSILIHANTEMYQLEQGTYRGGRTDIFKSGEYHNIVKLDINSMYPYVMSKYDYPTKPLSRAPITGLSVKNVQEALNDHKFIIGDFDILLKEPFLAVKRNKLIFPVGRIKNAYMTSPEIEHLLSGAGEIVKVNSAMLYEQENIFSEYVDYFYKLKSGAKTPVMKELSKLFLNSLYGKFGQRENGDITLDNSPENEIICQDNKIGSFWVNQGSDHYKVMKIGESFYKINPQLSTPGAQSSPIISSAVTSYARIYLWNLIKKCQVENVYYCDTDSIFTNRQGYDHMENLGFIDNKLLGKLKVEGIGSCVLRGPKDYDWIDQETGKLKRTIKGVPHSSIEQQDGGYKYKLWETGLNRYKNMSSAEVQIKDSVKYLVRKYDKGIIDNCGNVHPFVLKEF